MSDCDDEHQRILSKAARLPLLDALFAIHHYNIQHRENGPPPYCNPIQLTTLFPEKSREEIERAMSRVISLFSDAEALHRWVYPPSKEESIRDIEKLFKNYSDFSDESVQGAYFRGAHLNR